MTGLDLSNVTWGEFLIGDLFYKPTLKNKKINKKKDLSKIKSKEFNIPLVNAKFGNNGIMYYGREKDIDYIAMSIDIINDGAVSTGEVYPQIGKTGVLYNAYLIKYKQNISENILLFLTQSIKSGIKNKYGYGYKATWSKVQNDKIKLPVTKDGNIDYEFMDKYIQKIKENYYNKRKEQLDKNIKYKMKITEISDLNFKDIEKESLKKYYNNNINWKNYKIDYLFKKIKTKKVEKSQYGDLPATTASHKNNQLKEKVKRKNATILKNVFSATSDGEGKCFYQSKEFTILQSSYAFNLINEKEKNTKLFMLAPLNKIYSQYNWTIKSGWDRIKENYIKLPTTADGSIDYEFMELYTQAMNKYIIKKEIIKNEQYLNQLKTLTYKGD